MCSAREAGPLSAKQPERYLWMQCVVQNQGTPAAPASQAPLKIAHPAPLDKAWRLLARLAGQDFYLVPAALSAALAAAADTAATSAAIAAGRPGIAEIYSGSCIQRRGRSARLDFS